MPTYISIGDDVTPAHANAVAGAFKSGEMAVVVCHSICRTSRGRATMSLHLKRAGCPPELVARLGMQPSSPPKPAPVIAPVPVVAIAPVITEAIPRKRRRRHDSTVDVERREAGGSDA
jgi:hypothetical protein